MKNNVKFKKNSFYRIFSLNTIIICFSVFTKYIIQNYNIFGIKLYELLPTIDPATTIACLVITFFIGKKNYQKWVNNYLNQPFKQKATFFILCIVFITLSYVCLSATDHYLIHHQLIHIILHCLFTFPLITIIAILIVFLSNNVLVPFFTKHDDDDENKKD